MFRVTRYPMISKTESGRVLKEIRGSGSGLGTRWALARWSFSFIVGPLHWSTRDHPENKSPLGVGSKWYWAQLKNTLQFTLETRKLGEENCFLFVLSVKEGYIWLCDDGWKGLQLGSRSKLMDLGRSMIQCKVSLPVFLVGNIFFFKNYQKF